MRERVAGLIFLGGRARRLNGLDKASIIIGGRTCFERVSENIKPHTSHIFMSISEHFEIGIKDNTDEVYTVIRDTKVAKEKGMAGVLLHCLQEIAQVSDSTSIITSTVDTPFLPVDFAQKLDAVADPALPTVAKSQGIVHGLHALWPVTCIKYLKGVVLDRQEYSIKAIHQHINSTEYEFPLTNLQSAQRLTYDPFFNINSPEHLEQAKLLSTYIC